MISALLLSFFLNITLLVFPHSLPDTWKQYFVFTITCFIIGICVFLALLLHSLYIWKVTDIFKEAKVTFLYPSFILSISITLFFLSGECLGGFVELGLGPESTTVPPAGLSSAP